MIVRLRPGSSTPEVVRTASRMTSKRTSFTIHHPAEAGSIYATSTPLNSNQPRQRQQRRRNHTVASSWKAGHNTSPQHISRPSPAIVLPSTDHGRTFTTEDLDRSLNGRERVVILGSGWGGFTLARELDPKKYQVVIVSPRTYFVFTPFLASTSVGTLEFRTALEPIRSKRSQIQYIQGWADDISFRDKTVHVESAVIDPNSTLAPTESRWSNDLSESSPEVGRHNGELFDLRYDKLVIGVGSYSQTFGIPGVKEYANFLKDVGDSRKIRKKLLECFELAALPTATEQERQQLLHFAVVGGGPTGIEFSAELHDLIADDMQRLYPELAKYPKITVYDVAPHILSAFDERLSKYASDTFDREGIKIKTSTSVLELKPGLPGVVKPGDRSPGVTMNIKGEGEVGAGMVVWSTGLQSNPFIAKALDVVRKFPHRKDVLVKDDWAHDAESARWSIKHHERTGSIVTNDRMRVVLQAKNASGENLKAHMRDVFAIGDCASIESLPDYPATAQVASQKAEWLAKRLNKGDLASTKFRWQNKGTMAYIGNWKAILQSGNDEGSLSGRTAWLAWRSAYLYKSMSWRNRLLVPMYWLVNWVFGRDISRF